MPALIVTLQMDEGALREWQPLEACGIGLLLWRYLGGPWELIATIAFTGMDKAQGLPLRQKRR